MGRRELFVQDIEDLCDVLVGHAADDVFEFTVLNLARKKNYYLNGFYFNNTESCGACFLILIRSELLIVLFVCLLEVRTYQFELMADMFDHFTMFDAFF